MGAVLKVIVIALCIIIVSCFFSFSALQVGAAAEGAGLEVVASAEKAIDGASSLYNAGMEKYNAGEYSAALDCFNRALKTLIVCNESDLPSGNQQEYTSIFDQICLMQVRVRNLVYGFSVSVEDLGSTYSFPIVFNEEVEKWIIYYVTTDREYFAKRFYEAGKYIKMIKAVFREQGIPEELVYAAYVESGFNPYAYSVANAVGVWQFISYTGKLYGLDRNHWLDERRNVEKSTVAAAQFLKSLYMEFGSWELALAAYNCGPDRLARAIKDQGTRDFWQLILPTETKLYVPKIMAAIMIARAPQSYGFSDKISGEDGYEEVQISGCVDLTTIAVCCSAPLYVISMLNPELTRRCTPAGSDTYTVRIPKSTKELMLANFAGLSDKEKYLSEEEIAKRKGYWMIYVVRAGDNLGSIAKKFGTSMVKIKEWNPFVRRVKYIHPGDKLRVFARK